MTTYELTSIIFQGINILLVMFAAISLCIAAYQSKLSTKTYNAEREENIRCKTIEVIDNYSKKLQKDVRLTQKLIESLDDNKCRSIYDFKEFDVDKAIFETILHICFIDNLEKLDIENITKNYKNGNKYTIRGFLLTELRWHITSYLNSLEIVAISWHQGITDESILFDQFSFLVSDSRNMKKYRRIAGNGDSYPMTELFCNKIKERANDFHPAPKETYGQ